jgi:hypothetical protein
MEKFAIVLFLGGLGSFGIAGWLMAMSERSGS